MNLLTDSLRGASWSERVESVLKAALQAVEPSTAIKRHLKRDGDILICDRQTYDLSQVERLLVVGAGKAGGPMAAGLSQLLGENIHAGIVVVKDGHALPNAEHNDTNSIQILKRIQLLEASHPLPDERGLAGANQIKQLLSDSGENDLVICLISGGGSALLVSLSPGLKLDDLEQLTQALLASGASINEINTLRKHLEPLKGGGLARLAAPARLLTLILSDVVGNPLDVIASGPTVADPSTFQEAWEILTRYDLLEKAPTAVIEHIKLGLRKEQPETPKPGDPLFERVQNVIIGDNYQAANAALEQAHIQGFNTCLLTTHLQGEASQVGRFLAGIARQAAITGDPLKRPACIIAGGETTVTLHGAGLGGRNQELGLGAVEELTGLVNTVLVTLATDGGDGPTDAAGAVVTGETLGRARLLGLSPEIYLKENDSYHFFEELGDLLKTGPTLTNVNDLNFIFTL